ncbi:M20 family metallopeptidase [Pseudemcibacter aquimaris]|uniref:M20 family metallopeptidase n=1 Tax=Pseudemcibacter aquimaris TaxID=2857064 RepID=UPI0020115DA7|nr:M20/M25/M40 family metallo-hydrolase [Pseudemcibacter aquimaris]MCC3860174.1 M20/M25/M40 family metallo-hydrolase [Pseudemcibacter aquimaris]WDU57500.1 M20/M25/M40 family metallo-hydrolase [Pseudemcibacter aquimaris]
MFKLFKIVLMFIMSVTVTWAAERSLEHAVADDAVQKGLKDIDDTRLETANLLVKIGGIISPSGAEHDRAAAVAEEMRKIGLSDVRVNDAPNVIGRIPGRSGKALVFVATLDDLATVAENQRASGKPPVIDGDLVVGPGTNTSLTTVSLLSAAKALIDNGFTPEHDIVFAGVAEEETGLRGMKHLYAEYKDQAIGFVDVLGEGSSISYGALGIHWWKIHAYGPSGHTLNGGTPNLNQGIARAVDRILQIPEPQIYNDRRTRLNVAVLNSGSVFNHKPEHGWFSLDVRSLDLEHIQSMEEKVRKILDDVTWELGIKFEMEVVSDTPPGQIDGALESSLVQTSRAISNYLGNDPRMSNAGSANLNVSIAGGTLSIGISSSRGGRRGYPEEWADITVMQRTAKNVFLTAVTIGNAVAN